MKYKIQDHQVKQIEHIIYELASNGEVCREVARCRQLKDAELIMCMLNDQEAKVSK